MSDEYWMEFHKRRNVELHEAIEALREDLARQEREIMSNRMKLQAMQIERDTWRSRALEAKEALSWDQQKVYQLKLRYARHAARYRAAYIHNRNVALTYRETLVQFSQMKSRYTFFFYDVSLNQQTVQQCMKIIDHIRKTSVQALSKVQTDQLWWLP